MSNDLSSKLTDPRNNQQSRGMGFVTNSDQRGTTAYVTQQHREHHAHGGAVGGHDLLHLINPLHYTARKQGGTVSQSSLPRTKKRDYQAELDQRIAWQKQLANQRKGEKTELAHFTPQEMAFLKANPGMVQEVTGKYKAIAKKGQGNDTKLGKISKKTAKALDQLIHHGHEEVNERTGLREYMNNGDIELNQPRRNNIPLIDDINNLPNVNQINNFNRDPHNPPPPRPNTGREGILPELMHSGAIQRGGTCAANAAVGHVEAANRLGHYDPQRRNRFQQKNCLRFWEDADDKARRYVRELNDSPGRGLETKIIHDRTTIGDLLDRDKFIKNGVSGDGWGAKSKLADKMDNMIDKLNQQKGLSAYGIGFYNPEESGYHVVNIPRVHHYTSRTKRRLNLEGSMDINDSNNYRTVRGTIGTNGNVYAPLDRVPGRHPTEPNYYFNLKKTPVLSVDYNQSHINRGNDRFNRFGRN